MKNGPLAGDVLVSASAGRLFDGPSCDDSPTRLSNRPRPFLKWPGGKRSLVSKIANALPAEFGAYWEPFLGAGAMFLSLNSRDRQMAHLSDVNTDLIGYWKAVKDSPEELIGLLKSHESAHREEHYYQVRNTVPDDPLKAAARLIYLNKTCYNGLYRQNSRGEFNMALGSHTNPLICDEPNLRAVSTALTGVDVRCGDFESINPQSGDAVYCDPPYDGTFNGYDSTKFGESDQMRLREAAQRWSDNGASVVVSNSDTELIRDMWDGGWRLLEVRATRSISVDPSARGNVGELLIVGANVRSSAQRPLQLPVVSEPT